MPELDPGALWTEMEMEKEGCITNTGRELKYYTSNTQWVQHSAVLQNEAQHYGIVDAISYPTIQTDWMYIA